MTELFKPQFTVVQDNGRIVYACDLFEGSPERDYSECIYRGPDCPDITPPDCSKCVIWLGQNGVIQNKYFQSRRKTPTTPVSNPGGRLAKILKLRR